MPTAFYEPESAFLQPPLDSKALHEMPPASGKVEQVPGMQHLQGSFDSTTQLVNAYGYRMLRGSDLHSMSHLRSGLALESCLASVCVCVCVCMQAPCGMHTQQTLLRRLDKCTTRNVVPKTDTQTHAPAEHLAGTASTKWASISCLNGPSLYAPLLSSGARMVTWSCKVLW